MKALLLSLLFLSQTFASVNIQYCGTPIPSIANENNVHLLLVNSKNKPSEIVVADAEFSKELIDQMDTLESDYICLTGNMALEETVYLLEKITQKEFY